VGDQENLEKGSILRRMRETGHPKVDMIQKVAEQRARTAASAKEMNTESRSLRKIGKGKRRFEYDLGKAGEKEVLGGAFLEVTERYKGSKAAEGLEIYEKDFRDLRSIGYESVRDSKAVLTEGSVALAETYLEPK
jgi:hypothetical protein